jgi:50S ribosomal subunit-associated GTPase HflX
LSSSTGRIELDINSFVLENKVKIIAFEVCSPNVKAWKNYYPSANIVLLVIDTIRLLRDETVYAQTMEDVLSEIDNSVTRSCKVMVVFNKIDGQGGGYANGESSIVQKISALQHDVVSLKCSAGTGEGIEKLSKNILSIHKQISL